MSTQTQVAEHGSIHGSHAFERGYPLPETSRRIQDDADFERAVVAYRFWYPTVSMEGIFNGNRSAGIEDNSKGIAIIAGPRQVGFTLNSDTPYASCALDLSSGPFVVEMPVGSYIGLADDHHQGWILDMGIPGPDGGKGGKHLILPPNYTEDVPDGYYVGHSRTFKALLAFRSLPVGGDARSALKALFDIKIYPLATAGNPQTMELVDNSHASADLSCLRWEDNFQFWEVLHRVLDDEPIIDEFLPMYGLLAALGIEKDKPFAPDARLKNILARAAKTGRDQLLVSAFGSSRADRIAWPDRRWEWAGLIADNADFKTAAGIDLDARDRWFAQAIVTSPAMFRRTPSAGSLYWLGLRDRAGAYLDGGKTYRLSVPQPVPARLFWSVTAYDAQTRSEVQTDQDKAALSSLFDLRDAGSTPDTDLYFGPEMRKGAEYRWIKTTPGRGWFAYFRIYGPDAPAFDGTWKPGDFEEVT